MTNGKRRVLFSLALAAASVGVLADLQQLDSRLPPTPEISISRQPCLTPAQLLRIVETLPPGSHVVRIDCGR